MKVILIGFMGSGKSTVGQMLSNKINSNFIDLDEQIVISQKKSISEIFSKYGEKGFRKYEQEELFKSLKLENIILSTGGGTIILKENRKKIIESADLVIWLDAKNETLEKRIMGDPNRPLAKNLDFDALKKLKATRDELYENCAHMVIKTDEFSKEEVVTMIIDAVKGI